MFKSARDVGCNEGVAIASIYSFLSRLFYSEEVKEGVMVERWAASLRVSNSIKKEVLRRVIAKFQYWSY